MLSVCGHSRSAGYFPEHLHIEPGVVAEFAIITGLVLCLYGFRLLHLLAFMSGFLVSGLLVSEAFEHTFGLKTWVVAASWIGFVVMDIAGGCVALAFFPCGVFLVGSTLAYAFTSSLPYRMLPGQPCVVLDGAVVLLGGMLAWLLVRPFVIVASSLVGSVASVWGIGYFAAKYPNSDDIKRFHEYMKTTRKSWVHAVPGSWWGYLAAMVILFVVGMVKQCRDVGQTRSHGHIGHYRGWRLSPNT